jgi:hypothetical protein
LTHFGPLEQDIFPASHGLDSGQESPSLQETQLPALQTRCEPHVVPSEALVPVSWQVMLPVEQLYIPTWQGLLGVQLPPGVQDMHEPARQYLFGLAVVPQFVPLGTLPVSPHT